MNAKELGAQKTVPTLRQHDERNYMQAKAAGIELQPYLEGGLTKRELFAAMLMQEIVGNNEFSPDRREQECASDAIRYADALLAELAKDQP